MIERDPTLLSVQLTVGPVPSCYVSCMGRLSMRCPKSFVGRGDLKEPLKL